MSDIFNSLYDDIFLYNDTLEYDNDRIDDITKKYLEGKSSVEDKKFFLKLKREYCRVKKIKDYSRVQVKLYENKTRNEIISFEVVRILKNANLNAKIDEQINDIKKLLELCNGILSDELYNKIVNLIIRIEISLGIKIGLFDELCYMFESQMDMIEQGLIVVDSKMSKSK